MHRKFSQCTDVQDQHHALIAELGRAGDAFALRDRIFDSSHNDLSLSDYSIDRKSDRVCFLTNHQHVKLLATFVIQLKHTSEAKQRQYFAAIRDDFVVLQYFRRRRLDLKNLPHA